MKSSTHLEFWHVDSTILHTSDENAAPFPLKVGEQIMIGDIARQVVEVMDFDPEERDGVMHYRRIVRVN